MFSGPKGRNSKAQDVALGQSEQSTSSGTIRVAAGDLIISGGGLTNTATGIIDIQTDGVGGGIVFGLIDELANAMTE